MYKMEVADKPLFVENQYLGRDRGWVSVRLVMALFCFTAYYISSERERNHQLFLLVGCIILVVSIIMMYMLHYRITVKNKSVILQGLWTARLIKIDLNSIVKVENAAYSPYLINSPVYNLHLKGKIRFYAGGKSAVWLTDRDGLVYVVGTQHPNDLTRAILQAKES